MGTQSSYKFPCPSLLALDSAGLDFLLPSKSTTRGDLTELCVLISNSFFITADLTRRDGWMTYYSGIFFFF